MTLTREKLARALYETDTGTDGYQPLHLTVAWTNVSYRDHYYDRAAAILARLAHLNGGN